jgi:hypothetical protein
VICSWRLRSAPRNNSPIALLAPASPETIRHAGVLAAWGILLTPALGAVLMSASTVIVAINAQFLERVVL